MLKFVFSLTLCILSVATFAQTDQDVIGIIGKASAEMKTLECNFVQTKHLKILNDEMVSQGKMYYQQANKLRWEYTAPYSYTFILNDTHVLLKNTNRADVIDVNQNKMFKEIARLMMNSIVGNCLTDDKTFSTSIETTPDEWIATLIPLKKDIKQMWTKLILHFDKSKKSVVKVEMHEKNGDYTEISLKDIKTNTAIDQNLFNIK